MNPVAVGDGLHWSNFLFTIEKKKALGLLESFSEKAQKKQVILLSLISSASFLPLIWFEGDFLTSALQFRAVFGTNF